MHHTEASSVISAQAPSGSVHCLRQYSSDVVSRQLQCEHSSRGNLPPPTPPHSFDGIRKTTLLSTYFLHQGPLNKKLTLFSQTTHSKRIVSSYLFLTKASVIEKKSPSSTCVLLGHRIRYIMTVKVCHSLMLQERMLGNCPQNRSLREVIITCA